MTIPSDLQHVLASDAQFLGGSVRFKGTRVPVQALLDTLDDGDGLTEFLDGYPGVTREQAEAVIHWQQTQTRKVLGLELAG